MFISKIGAFGVNFHSNNNVNVPRAQQQTKIQFEKEQDLSRKADSISANPITLIAYKLYRSYKFMTESDSESVQPSKNKVNLMA